MGQGGLVAIAYHRTMAIEGVEEDEPELARSALRLWGRAAAEAEKRHATEEAVRLYVKALETADKLIDLGIPLAEDDADYDFGDVRSCLLRVSAPF